VQCLEHVKAWSDARPRHLPIAILVELKDDPIIDPLQLGFVQPHPIGVAELDALDAEIRSVFPDDRVITPDDVRGTRPTLEEAVLGDGWPTLGAARGQVMFLMDNGGRFRTDYLAGHPSLAGRMLFTNSNPGLPDAAFVKRNDPRGPATAEIQDLVRRGYLVRTRADADTLQARTGDTTQRDAALLSGAHFVSTDYPVPGRSAPFGTDYVAQMPDGDPARCNPMNTGTHCRSAALERLH
jgi:Phosphoinositide phospholipase C, Ca2+-dependent